MPLLKDMVLAIWPVSYALILPQAAASTCQSHTILQAVVHNNNKPTLTLNHTILFIFWW
jgi:hypothetical protein